MSTVTLCILRPVIESEVDASKNYIETCKTKNEYLKKYELLYRLCNALEIMGFKKWSGNNSVIEMEGSWCNGHGVGRVELWEIDEKSLDSLEGRAKSLEEIRKQGLAKLTEAEKSALGLL